MKETPDFIKAINLISEQIILYRTTDVSDGETLNTILQQVSATLFYLEKERSKYHDMFQIIIQRGISEKKSVARAENEAHIAVPELYKLRHLMESAYKVCDAIRSNLSWLKIEINKSNIQK